LVELQHFFRHEDPSRYGAWRILRMRDCSGLPLLSRTGDAPLADRQAANPSAAKSATNACAVLYHG